VSERDTRVLLHNGNDSTGDFRDAVCSATSRDVLIFISETNNEPGRDSQIILMAIDAVSEMRQIIIGLERSKPKMTIESKIQAPPATTATELAEPGKPPAPGAKLPPAWTPPTSICLNG